MTEYDYSPAAYEQHLAKQARIAEWSSQSSQVRDQYTNPFKPSDDELAKKKQSEFYGPGDDKYEGPDRPPTPTLADSMAAMQRAANPALYYAGRSGYVSPPVDPALAATAGRILVPRWTGKAWVYEEQVNPYRKTTHSSSSSVKSSKRPSPKRSQTMPVGYAYPPGVSQPQQQQYYYRSPPNSGNTVTSQGSGGVGYAYSGPTVIVDGATPRKGNKLKKKEKSGDGASFFGRLS
ncbi:hypothetical protein D9611_010608 [Ephemerocybe angulata]|uniref:Uncharacterized protein n=1 Tax=Ephemerocybe angulata TaxID=980116 RepID=A0A8H5BVL1_9AGAR|nr:hypothetical protein D9611_010608 [Tulosesus angulatus]